MNPKTLQHPRTDRVAPTGPDSLAPGANHSPPASSPHSTEYADPHVLRPGEAKSLLAGAPWKRFAVIGDSLAEGLGDETDGYLTISWADRVAAELAAPGYLNLGRERLTAAEVVEDQLDRALGWQPDLVAVIAGGNDILKADPDLAATEQALETIFRRSRASGADVIGFTLMDPSPIFDDPALGRRIGALNSMIRHAGMRTGASIVDAAIRSYSDDRSIYSADLKHPNMRGHAVVASAVIEELAELLRAKDGQF